MIRRLVSSFRLLACLAATSAFLSGASALAVGVATVDLAGATFGKGFDVHLTSGATVVPPSSSYDYKISGTVHGTGLLSGILPVGTNISTLLERVQAGSSSVLEGTQLNPNGTLPVSIVDREFSGTFAVGAGLNVTGSLRMIGRITPAGQIRFHIVNVNFTIPGFNDLGTVVFESGSKVVVSVKPVVEFRDAAVTVRENAGTLQVRVRRRVNTESAMSVQYSSAPGTATASDFDAVSGTLSFAPGEVVKIFNVTIKNRAGLQGNRVFRLRLSSPTGAVIGVNQREVVTIIDAR